MPNLPNKPNIYSVSSSLSINPKMSPALQAYSQYVIIGKIDTQARSPISVKWAFRYA